MLYGRLIADELDGLGLLASDDKSEFKPSLWRVSVRNTGMKSWQHSGLASEFRQVAGRGGSASKIWSKEGTARKQAVMAKNRGLEVMLTSCAVVELVTEIL